MYADAWLVTQDSHTGAGRLTIDLGAVVANWRAVAARQPGAETGAVVKADAYGLGARRVARALAAAGCRSFFVAQLGEAVELRRALPPEARLFVLNGLVPGAEALAVETGAVPVLNSLPQVARYAAEARRRDRRLPAALQVDSGMSRLGLSPAEVDTLAADPTMLDGVEVVLVMSHLACADEPANPANAAQHAAFVALADRLPAAPRALANSAGSAFAGFGHEVTRPGLALYGVEPTGRTDAGLRPVVTLEAPVVQLRTVAAGTGVGYGLSHVTSAETRLATIGVGYADGWPRHLGGRGAVWFDGVRLPIVGRVSMDSLTVDVSALPEGALAEGAMVELVGPHQSLQDVADAADTIAWEILTRLGARYERRYLEAGPAA
ncbi:alanine racemase [Oharaeibacter diazotrophicus]|uniref:Alanine racemase n=4 Tax=Oharaeibacter diazotrophicus TaxID=1920512 RepID=A0A4R6R5N6_9HYPH|nr:alanine racemase [Oharaeibacter diazotrophicus]TDP81112.1 alanine racemase [Oharaeibacter diazotrophicus]BBE74894.1 alanine racemase, biosynthetic [Pleomorphomonas sp. SM30]GLS75601.1 alanine racemase [Oharaeibacter diazotrophicus]